MPSQRQTRWIIPSAEEDVDLFIIACVKISELYNPRLLYIHSMPQETYPNGVPYRRSHAGYTSY